MFVIKKQSCTKQKPKKIGLTESTRRKPVNVVLKIKEEQEALRRQKEDKERAENEKKEKLQLLRKMKEDAERLKNEKKEKEKQKCKDKKELEKKNGKYKTDKEKQKLKESRAKFGVEVINGRSVTETVSKRPFYEKLKKQTNKVKIVDGDDWKKMENEKQKSGSERSDVLECSNSDYWKKSKESKYMKKEKVMEVGKETQEMGLENTDPMTLDRLIIQPKKLECKRNLRTPIICILGHVDTGKTKILDKLRHTNVQGKEFGGITQQIGATNVPLKSIPNLVDIMPDLRFPGLLIIDTPGHESFNNMRMRGSSICDIAVLVVDLMHGVQDQTRESLKLLREGGMPFIIALNKIDRLVDWHPNAEKPINVVMDAQTDRTKFHFQDQLNQTIADFAILGLNVRCFWHDDGDEDYVNIVPTSALSGDGMNDLIRLLCKYGHTRLGRRLEFSEKLEASVIEVKETAGHGTTLDVILVNGRLKANDTIVVGGQEGPIVTKIRYLLKPSPMAELRVKGEMTKHDQCVAAQGIKIVAKDLEKVIPGLPIYVANTYDEVELYKRMFFQHENKNTIKSIKLDESGVYVQTSTVGSLEALLTELRKNSILFSGINIGTINKKDIAKAMANKERDPKWGVILAFNVKVEAEAVMLAKANGIQIFQQEIMYSLIDDITNYLAVVAKATKDRLIEQAVSPVKLKIKS